MSEYFGRDLTDQFNTVLSPEEEQQFQQWAAANRRTGDLYDYDLRGAWKELLSGLMSEDARGHLGDKYKKPSHPTFSRESIYAAQVPGAGQWSECANGTAIYRVKEQNTRVIDALKRYFQAREPGAILEIERD